MSSSAGITLLLVCITFTALLDLSRTEEAEDASAELRRSLGDILGLDRRNGGNTNDGEEEEEEEVAPGQKCVSGASWPNVRGNCRRGFLCDTHTSQFDEQPPKCIAAGGSLRNQKHRSLREDERDNSDDDDDDGEVGPGEKCVSDASWPNERGNCREGFDCDTWTAMFSGQAPECIVPNSAVNSRSIQD